MPFGIGGVPGIGPVGVGFGDYGGAGSGAFVADIGGPIFAGDFGGNVGEIPPVIPPDIQDSINDYMNPQAFDWTSFFENMPYGPADTDLPGSMWGVPEMPSMMAALGQLQPYNIPGLPQFDYENLDPTTRASIERPYMRAMEMAREQLGGQGMLGTQRGGGPLFSGAAGQRLGEMAQEAGPVMAKTAFNMMMPMQMQGWQADLARNMTGYNTALQGIGTDFAQEVARRGEVIGQQMLPYSILPGLLGGTYSTPLVQQGQNPNIGGGLMGGMMGAALPGMLGLANPLWPIIGGLGGFLGGI